MSWRNRVASTIVRVRRVPSWIARLWQVPEGGKIADRPHPLTMLVGTLGPIATIAAVSVTGYFAYRSSQIADVSLGVAQQNMKVGQRAYVVIEKSHSEVVLMNAVKTAPSAPDRPSLMFAVEQSFQIKNLGRTPASLKELTLRFYLPGDWWTGADARPRFQRDGDWWVYEQPIGGELA